MTTTSTRVHHAFPCGRFDRPTNRERRRAQLVELDTISVKCDTLFPASTLFCLDLRSIELSLPFLSHATTTRHSHAHQTFLVACLCTHAIMPFLYFSQLMPLSVRNLSLRLVRHEMTGASIKQDCLRYLPFHQGQATSISRIIHHHHYWNPTSMRDMHPPLESVASSSFVPIPLAQRRSRSRTAASSPTIGALRACHGCMQSARQAKRRSPQQQPRYVWNPSGRDTADREECALGREEGPAPPF